MDSMKCFQCALKHTAKALSYGKQIVSGHGKGADLDHRIDFLGQITNLEDHLKLLSEQLFTETKNYRQQIQAKRIEIIEQDLQYIRELYIKIEKQQKGQNTSENQIEIDIQPAVLFLKIENKDYFDLCYTMLKKNLKDYSKIYYLESELDLSDYEIEKIDFSSIKEKYIYIINEKTVVLRSVSAKTKYIIADNQKNFNYKQIIKQIKQNQPYYYFDNFPAIVQKDLFQQYIEKDYPLTYYCNKYSSKQKINPYQIAFKLDKVLCCSNKSKTKTAIFCYLENKTAFDSMKKFLVDYNNK